MRSIIQKLIKQKDLEILEKKDPTYNVILMAHEMSKDFLNKIRKKKELEDIKTIFISKKGIDLNVMLDSDLPANSVIFMKDEDPVAAWIEGELKLITKKI